MSVEEAAVFLKLKEETIYSLKFKGKIPYHKKGKRLYFSREELTTWIKEGRGKTQKEIENEAETYVRKNQLGR
jgi:excisionase family DNA binding protein